jgi:hypothetical protein
MSRSSLIRSIALVCVTASLAPAAEPKLLETTKIWDQGQHNAFTDLTRWRNQWYCVFREAEGHVGGDGKLRVLESADGKAWKSVALVEEDGIDLRDPHLSITPDDRLMIVAGGSVYGGTKILKGRQPRVSFSTDARKWTAPQRVLSEGEWLWRITWHDGKAYGVSYNAGARQTQDAKDAAKESKPVSSDPAEWKLRLVVSHDGVKYDTITHLGVPGHPNETTLRFLPNGDMLAMVRREGGSTFGWIGRSPAPYKEWTWHETKHRFGGPNFISLPDGSLIASSRRYPQGPKTVLARMTPTSYEPFLELPSGGDTSYAGLVWHQGLLWVSYYASHEGKSSIYLAKVRLPEAAIDIGNRLELFVDDALIDELRGGAKQKLHRPKPEEVVFTADHPWEGNTSAYFTIFRDGDLFRMYYRGSHADDNMKATHPEVACYAESKDGLHWTKPALGLFEYAGSKENNIVWTGLGSHNFTPFKDANPKAAADARYKALASGKGGLLALKSADGIHWSLMSDKPVITKGAFDSQNLAFWDPAIGKYRDYHRAFRVVRDIMTCTSDDFLTWTPPTFLEYPGVPLDHLYTNAVRPYERAPHFLLGFPTRFLPKTEQTEPTFMASRDGVVFKRWTEPVIPATAPKDRDGNRSNYMAWGMVQLPGRDNELTVYGKEAYYKGPGSRLRRFTYRVDGFVSIYAPPTGGEVVTKPIRFQGSKLVLNYTAAPTGYVAVEVQNDEGYPIKAFVLSQCRKLNGNSISETVVWNDSADLKQLTGTPVRLRFVLRRAELFSYRFQ